MSFSTKEKAHKTIAIIGAGCAGWSLAARADQLSASHIELFKKPKGIYIKNRRKYYEIRN